MFESELLFIEERLLSENFSYIIDNVGKSRPVICLGSTVISLIHELMGIFSHFLICLIQMESRFCSTHVVPNSKILRSHDNCV